METIYFLIFIGVCAFVVIWVTRGSKAKSGLKAKPAATPPKIKSELLRTRVDSPLSHKEELWERRRNQAAKDFTAVQLFVPKSEATDEPEYDGYSRRDRHHVTKTSHVAEETRVKSR